MGHLPRGWEPYNVPCSLAEAGSSAPLTPGSMAIQDWDLPTLSPATQARWRRSSKMTARLAIRVATPRPVPAYRLLTGAGL